MSDITVHEARQVLQKLYNERKAIEKALQVVDVLSDIEVNLTARQTALENLGAQVAAKQAQLEELEENISDIHTNREAACRQREQESAAKVSVAQKALEVLQATCATQTANIQAEIEQLEIVRAERGAALRETVESLQLEIADLRQQRSDLQAAARAMAGL